MGLKRKLKGWEKAELISADQAAKLLEHERKGMGQKFFRGLFGMALLAIIAGLCLLVASNWAAIPGELKLAVHFIINAVVAYVLFQGQKTQHFWKREVGTAILGGLNLTLIALVGQVFQLDGTLESALLLWLIISTPLFLIYGESRINAVLWTVAFVFTIVVNLEGWIEYLDLERAQENSLYIFLITAVPCLLTFIGMNNWFKAHREEWQDVYLKTGIGLIVFGGLSTSFMWYDDAHSLSKEFKSFVWFPLFNFAFWGGLFIAARKFSADILESETYKALCLLSAVTMIFAFAVFIPGRPEIDTMATVQFIAYAVLLGYFAIPLGLSALITVSIFLITLRIFAFYIELTGPMFAMGLGLIVTGIILLVALRFALKLDKKIKAKLMDGVQND